MRVTCYPWPLSTFHPCVPPTTCAHEDEAHSLGIRRAKGTSARKLLSHEQKLMSTLPPPSRVCGNSAQYTTVNHLASKHRLGLITGRCPTLTDYREVRKGLDVKSGSPLMKSYTCPLDKLLHRVRIPGRLRNFDGDSNEVNSRSFKLHRDYPSSLNLWIVRKLSWRWIIRDGIHVKETKENLLTCDHVPCAEVGKKCTKKCDAHTCLVVGGC